MQPENAPSPAATPADTADHDAPVVPVGADRPSFVVGIGASAGGLDAIERFFDNLPADSTCAFVVVQHLSPDYKSLMVEILSKHTSLPVCQVEDDMLLRRGCVYLLPPGKNVTVEQGHLVLTERATHGGAHLPIDLFLRSLAADARERAVAIILSGTGSDGSRGVRSVKEAGGLVLVQDETTAQFDGMPRAAIATGLVDIILPPEEMPAQLVVTRAEGGALRPALVLVSHEEGLSALIALLRRHTGMDFTYYKPNTILRRIERRMAANQITDFDDYVRFARHFSAELFALSKDLLIGVTKFFRDRDAFDFLLRRVIVPLVEQIRPEEALRVWVPGCSSGEEAYSLAMLFTEAAEELGRNVPIKIFATDIDRDAITVAANGVYSETAVADLTPQQLARHFTQSGQSYTISRALRQNVIFAHHDLIKDPPFSKVDLISCRNLLIYLEPILQRKILTLFHFSLRHDRYLFLGSSETIGDVADHYLALDNKWKIYQRRNVERLGVAPALPTATLPRELPASLSSAPRRAGRTVEHAAVDLAYQFLVSQYVPVGLLVDETMELLHVFGNAHSYLRIQPGKVTLDLLKVIPRSIAAVVGPAISKTLRDQDDICYHHIPVPEVDDDHHVDLRLRVLVEPRGQQRYYLILIEPNANPEPVLPAVITGDYAARQRKDLEQELYETRESLQATIEELETSNEELQATTEELLSANEELRSVNEELYSVNAEYQHKIQELLDLNADMDNLLRSTNIGTLFLDQNLLIRKFTPAIRDQINLIGRDVGRPIEHLSLNIDHPGFIDDVRQVLQSRAALEREIEAQDGRRLLMRVLPYVADDSTHAGVVVTFVDVTAVRQLRQLQRLIDALPEHIAVVDHHGVIMMVNQAWKSFGTDNGLARRGGVGANYLEICRETQGDDRDSAMAVHDAMQEILAGQRMRYLSEYPCHAPLVQRWFRLYINRVEGEPPAALLAHTDITRQKELEQLLSRVGALGKRARVIEE